MEIKLFKEANGIIIPRVEVVGPKRTAVVELVLDTGAAHTMINWETMSDIGYNPASAKKTLPMLTANGRIHVPLIYVEKLAIGKLEVKNAPIICHNIPEMVGVSGLLGLSFLKHFRTVIDYRSELLTIE